MDEDGIQSAERMVSPALQYRKEKGPGGWHFAIVANVENIFTDAGAPSTKKACAPASVRGATLIGYEDEDP